MGNKQYSGAILLKKQETPQQGIICSIFEHEGKVYGRIQQKTPTGLWVAVRFYCSDALGGVKWNKGITSDRADCVKEICDTYDNTCKYYLIYIYGIQTEIKAELRLLTIPDQCWSTMSIGKVTDKSKKIEVYTSTSNYNTILLNTSNKPVFIRPSNGISTGELIELASKIPMTLPTGVNFEIRLNKDLIDISYTQLTLTEREKYIPSCLTNILTSTFSAHTKCDWVEKSKNQIHMTLKYIPTRDKEIHMINEKTGVKYRFTLEAFRPFIPFFNNGIYTGVFELNLYGSRNMRVLPTPISHISDYEICIDESSDEEQRF